MFFSRWFHCTFILAPSTGQSLCLIFSWIVNQIFIILDNNSLLYFSVISSCVLFHFLSDYQKVFRRSSTFKLFWLIASKFHKMLPNLLHSKHLGMSCHLAFMISYYVLYLFNFNFLQHLCCILFHLLCIVLLHLLYSRTLCILWLRMGLSFHNCYAR